MKLKQLLIIAILLISVFGYGQPGENEFSKEPIKLDFGFATGILIQKEIFTEVNILIGKIYADTKSKIPILGFSGARLGIESNLKSNNDFILAPKLGYEISITFFSIRLSALNYFKNTQSEFRILPEFGASIGGMFNLTYGYGISFGNTISGISNHRLSFSINLNRKLSEANRKLRAY